MRKTKYFLSAILVLTMLLSLVGCGGSNESAPPSDDPGDSSPPEVTIEYWHINSETMGGPTTAALIDKFNETNDKNITVINKYIPDAYQGVATTLQSSLAAGAYPGVIQAGYNFLNYFAENFPQYTSPTDIIKNYAPEDAGYLEDRFEDNIIQLATSVNGDLLGLPYACSTPVVYVNADLMKEAGLDPENPPVTFDEMIEAGKKIKASTGENGFYIEVLANTWATLPLLLGSGAEMYEMVDGKAVATFNTPEVVDTFEKWQKAFSDGATIDIANDEALAAFAAGKLGMYVTTIARRSYMEESCDFDLRTIPFPVVDEEVGRKVCVGGNILMVVGKTDDEIKASWEFVKFLMENENMATWVKGTGYVPSTKGVAEDPAGLKDFFEENKLMQAVLDSWPDAVSWTSWPGENGLQVDQILIDMRDAIISSNADPASTISQAQDAINELLGSK